MPNRIHKVSLERLAKEKLAKQIVDDIDIIELEVLEDVDPGVTVDIGKRTIRLRINLTISTKKFLAWLGGTIVAIAIATLKWIVPILYSKPP